MNDSSLQAACLQHMPVVLGYDNALNNLRTWWQKVTLIGKINSLSVAHTLIDDMLDTQQRFQELQDSLIANLVSENLRKLDQEFTARAQVAIDILVRNLFERTADVGFLATDNDIRAFLSQPSPDALAVEHIVERLCEYTAKYSVYDEIIILDPHGRVCVHLDADNPITYSRDPLLHETLNTDAPYVETFRASDLQPGRRVAHIFSAPIRVSDNPNSEVLGILCLCFRFDDEMRGIFANLARPGEIIAIIDQGGRVIASSDESQLALGAAIQAGSGNSIKTAKHHNDTYLSRTTPTRGYQGYYGLAWQGHVMRTLKTVFTSTEANPQTGYDLSDSRLFSNELRTIRRNAALITDDLTLIVMNGQIVAAKRDAAEFMPVLDEIRNIGLRTREVFDHSLSQLYHTVVAALLSEVQFQAFLAVDIMDRNLYERANDVRWWALTSLFRESLARKTRHTDGSAAMNEVLAYINGLYTVYTNLILFDDSGTIVAVSDENERHLVGQAMPDAALVRATLNVTDSQRYLVSPFAGTPLYANRHTYIYLTSLRAPESSQVVGGIGIVFDSAPQFKAMLEDSLPRDAEGKTPAGVFGVFVERSGHIIASTRDDIKPGSQLALKSSFHDLKSGERGSAIMEYDGHTYAVGAAMSQGYREYKTTGDYENDVLALIFVPL